MNAETRTKNARKSLLGVSIGDAFGDSFFGEGNQILQNIYERKIPETKWEFTDDTVMSIAVFQELVLGADINQDSLIKRFIVNHNLDRNRGYGATLRRVLREIEEGKDWHYVSKNVFDGQGSMGNGAAMRVCPIGAYYFDDLNKVRELAIKSAEVTHSSPEAIAGAIAVATGTALTTKMSTASYILNPDEFINQVLAELPDTDTKSKIAKAKDVSYNFHIETVKTILGNGTKMTSQDTVPFAIWCTAYNLKNFREALWKAVSVLGDRDTICAMVAGMTIMSSDAEHIPEEWVNSVEQIDDSMFLKEKPDY